MLFPRTLSAEDQAAPEAPGLDEETFGLSPWVLDELDDDDALALLEALESIEAEDRAALSDRLVPKADSVQPKKTLADEYNEDAASFLAREKLTVVRPTCLRAQAHIQAPDEKLKSMLSASLTRASMSFPNQVRRPR